MDFEFGQSDKAKAFFKEHPNFCDAFVKLMDASNQCFGRMCHYNNRAEEIMFSLGQTCREDYLEIAFMAVHGFSVATTKLLRGLYERAVTHAYIIKNPEKVMKFILFGAIQEYKVMKGALETGITEEAFDKTMPAEYSIASITERRNKAMEDFKVKKCETCGEKPMVSWDDANINGMAKAAGPLYQALYSGGYAIPNLRIHATLTSAVYLEGADKESAAAVRKQAAYSNLGLASAMLLLVMEEQNELFKLGLDQDLKAAEEAIAEEWFEVDPIGWTKRQPS